TVSSSSIADSVNSGVAGMNLKSSSQTGSVVNSPRLLERTPPEPLANPSTTPTRNLSNRASVSAIHHTSQPQNVRQRQPPPPPPGSQQANSNGGGRQSTIYANLPAVDPSRPSANLISSCPRSH